jgi:hypothetical protein
MSPIKRNDVENHLHPPFLTKIHLCEPVSQPDVTGYSVAEPDAIQANPLNFAEDFVAEHSSSSNVQVPDAPLTGSFGPQAPAASKSGQP